MARIRSAKPQFWTDPLMCSLPRDVRFTFKGIWEVMADDVGRFQADARLVKSQVWPLDDDITTKKLEVYLARIAGMGRIELYEVDGVRYGSVVNWSKHQKVSHPTPSIFPDPPSKPPEPFANRSRIMPEAFPNVSALSGAERIRSREDLESGAEGADLDPVVRDEDRSAPPAPRVVLPVEAERFLERFYSLPSTTDKRRADVRRQVYETLDPDGKGARLRHGTYAKARSAEHLAHCCRAVMDDPPRAIDAAIVILLTKLLDPPPGPTPSEIVKVQEDKRAAEEEKYHAEMRRAGLTWAQANPAEYETIRLEVDARYANGVGGSFAKMARDSELAQKCASRAGFITFDAWRIAS